MKKVALPLTAAALLAVAPAWAEIESETHAETTHVEERGDAGAHPVLRARASSP